MAPASCSAPHVQCLRFVTPWRAGLLSRGRQARAGRRFGRTRPHHKSPSCFHLPHHETTTTSTCTKARWDAGHSPRDRIGCSWCAAESPLRARQSIRGHAYFRHRLYGAPNRGNPDRGPEENGRKLARFKLWVARSTRDDIRGRCAMDTRWTIYAMAAAAPSGASGIRSRHQPRVI